MGIEYVVTERLNNRDRSEISEIHYFLPVNHADI